MDINIYTFILMSPVSRCIMVPCVLACLVMGDQCRCLMFSLTLRPQLAEVQPLTECQRASCELEQCGC